MIAAPTLMTTIKNVAEQAGVSTSTVSRVLSSSPNVREGTRERVLRVIDELGFQPSEVARGLVSRRTRLLGVVVSDISNPFYPQVIRGIDDVANAAGYTIVLLNTDDELHRDAQAIAALRRQRVEGIILGSARLDAPSVTDLVASDVPTVLTNRGLDGKDATQVTLDNRRGGELVTEHLISRGHRRLLHLGGPAYAQNARERAEGFLAAARRGGLSGDAARVLEVGFHTVSATQGVDQQLRGRLQAEDRPTAILAVDDVLAVRAMELATHELGLRVPEDLAVAGFDDSFLAASRFVQLTTISHRPYEMGATAARLILTRIDGRAEKWPVQIQIEPRLIVRRSTGA